MQWTKKAFPSTSHNLECLGMYVHIGTWGHDDSHAGEWYILIDSDRDSIQFYPKTFSIQSIMRRAEANLVVRMQAVIQTIRTGPLPVVAED